MKKNYSLQRGFSLAMTTLCGVMVMTTSCVNNELDLDKELDLEVNLGGSITIPLGYLSPIMLGDMLDTDDIDLLEAMEDGDYKITVEDSISIDLSSLTETDGVSITGVDGGEKLTTELDIPEFPSFGLEVEPSTTAVETGLEQASTGNAVDIIQNVIIHPSLENIPVTENTIISEIAIPLSFEGGYSQINIGDEISIPEQIISIEEILFGEANGETDGSLVEVSIDLSPISAHFIEDTFIAVVDFVEITFPEGYVLTSDDNISSVKNIFRRENISNENFDSVVSFSFAVEKFDFEGEGIVSSGDILSRLNGDISTIISESLFVSGTTNGQTSSENAIVDVASNINIKDMNFTVAQVESQIQAEANEDGSPYLSSAINIELDDLITSVSYVTLEEGSNVLTLSVGSIESILPASGDPIQINFPADKFVIEESEDIFYNAAEGCYTLEIPISKVVNGDGYEGEITIQTIKFDNEITQCEAPESNYIAFDPQIEMVGTTLFLGDAAGSSLSLSAYNDFAAKEQEIVISLSDNNLLIADADITISGYEITLDDMSTSIEESIEIPDDLTEIYTMTFANDVFLTIDITAEVDGVDDCALSFNNYTIELPKFLKFASEDFASEQDITLSEDNVMTLNAAFEITQDEAGNSLRKFYRQYQIEEIDFTAEEYSDVNTVVGGKRMFILNEEILLSGALSLEAGDIDIEQLSEVVVSNVSYGVSDMEIAKVYGLFSPELESGSEPFDLSDLAEDLDGDLSIVLSNPTIQLTATNSLDIPVQIDRLTLTPTKNGELIQTQTIEGETIYTVAELAEPIVIEAAKDGVESVTVICITADDKEDQDGVKYVQMENFRYILDGLPDDMTMEYNASVLDTQTHMVDLSRDENNPYYFDLEYSLDIPLTFDSLTLDYTTEIEDLGDSLGDLLEVVSSLELYLDVESTMPISLTIKSITPLDAEGKAITGLESFVVDGASTIAANGSSRVELQLKDNAAGDLSLVDALEINIYAEITSTEGGEALNAEQCITIKASACLPDGITLDLGDE